MTSILISINPKWCELIVNGKKTIEVRKTRPKIETPFKCYIYCTMGDKLWVTTERFRVICNGKSASIINAKDVGGCYLGNGKVIGEFVCDEIFPIRVFENGTIQDYMFHGAEKSCVPYDDIANYIGNDCIGYGWRISDLEIYDNPRELSEFGRGCDAENIGEIRCRDCKKLVSFDDCCEIMCKPLNRPPQSWCYVEELP